MGNDMSRLCIGYDRNKKIIDGEKEIFKFNKDINFSDPVTTNSSSSETTVTTSDSYNELVIETLLKDGPVVNKIYKNNMLQDGMITVDGIVFHLAEENTNSETPAELQLISNTKITSPRNKTFAVYASSSDMIESEEITPITNNVPSIYIEHGVTHSNSDTDSIDNNADSSLDIDTPSIDELSDMKANYSITDDTNINANIATTSGASTPKIHNRYISNDMDGDLLQETLQIAENKLNTINEMLKHRIHNPRCTSPYLANNTLFPSPSQSVMVPNNPVMQSTSDIEANQSMRQPHSSELNKLFVLDSPPTMLQERNPPLDVDLSVNISKVETNTIRRSPYDMNDLHVMSKEALLPINTPLTSDLFSTPPMNNGLDERSDNNSENATETGLNVTSLKRKSSPFESLECLSKEALKVNKSIRDTDTASDTSSSCITADTIDLYDNKNISQIAKNAHDIVITDCISLNIISNVPFTNTNTNTNTNQIQIQIPEEYNEHQDAMYEDIKRSLFKGIEALDIKKLQSLLNTQHIDIEDIRFEKNRTALHLAVKKYLMLKQIAEKKKHYTFGKRTQVEHDMVLIKDIITYLLTFKIDMCVCDETNKTVIDLIKESGNDTLYCLFPFHNSADCIQDMKNSNTDDGSSCTPSPNMRGDHSNASLVENRNLSNDHKIQSKTKIPVKKTKLHQFRKQIINFSKDIGILSKK